MKVKEMMAVALVVLMSACQQAEVEEVKDESKQLSFKVDFDVEQTGMSRSAISEHITSLDVYDYVAGSLINELNQVSTDDKFGSVILDAVYGTHELVFVGHNSTTATYNYNNSMISFDKVMDTFTAYQSLEVGVETNEQQTVTLTRQVAGIKLVMLDAVPDNATSIELTVSGYSESLDPKTGLGSTGVEHVRNWTYSNNHIGMTNTSYSLYTFLPSEEHVVNIVVRVIGNDGSELAHFLLEDIPVEKNRMTVITGNVLSASLTSTVVIDGAWGEDIEVSM